MPLPPGVISFHKVLMPLFLSHVACGLYYLAELVEEYTVQTKRVIKGLTLVTTPFFYFCPFDRLPDRLTDKEANSLTKRSCI